VDIGSIEARTRERETIPVLPGGGGSVPVAGTVLLVVPGRKRVTNRVLMSALATVMQEPADLGDAAADGGR